MTLRYAKIYNLSFFSKSSGRAIRTILNARLRRGELTTKEVGLLATLIILRAGDIDLLSRIGVIARIEHHRREGHRRGG